jgi:hypothetical protein
MTTLEARRALGEMVELAPEHAREVRQMLDKADQERKDAAPEQG